MSALCEELYGEEKAELIGLNYDLLDAIVDLNYDAFDELCADDISCLEPETNQNVVIGKEFHKYYFDVFGTRSSSNGDGDEDTSIGEERGISGMNAKTRTVTNVTMVQPHVQFMGDESNPIGAVVSYVKLTQGMVPGKPLKTIQQSETRVWEKRDGKWVNIHFHKSPYKA